MDQSQKQALQVTKEIVIKFIEVGRISPGNCQEFFSQTYHQILQTIKNSDQEQIQADKDQGLDS
ncbi:MAG: hypothetical protein ACOCV7_05640 [Desulfonatronovibrionaceae bacterium]